MNKIFLSSSVVFAFSVYILLATPDVNQAIILPAQVSPPNSSAQASTLASGTAPTSTPAPVPSAPAPQPATKPSPKPSPAPKPAPQPAPQPAPAPAPKPAGLYKDGTYTGQPADAFYGTVQVQATVQGGRLADVTFLQYPNDRSTSVFINSQAMPYLKQEALQAQSANVDIVSGATDTSQAFQQSLASALVQAKV